MGKICAVFFLLFSGLYCYAGEEILPVVSIIKTKAPPVIDGEIEEEEWKYASSSTGFVDLSGNITKDDTIVYVTYDEENLYFAFKSTVKGKIKAEATQRDGQTYEDDAIEIFLQPDPKEKVYYQFVGNSIGTIYDGKGQTSSWNGNWIFKNQVKDSGETMGGILTFGKKIWTSEVAISFKDLGVDTPEDMQFWRVNFCRDWNMEEREEGESGKWTSRWTSWSGAYEGNFHKTEGFGYLYFRDKTPVIKVESWGDLIGGDINVKGNILNSTPKDLNLSCNISVSLSKTGKEIKRREIPLNISSSKEQTLEIKENIELSRSAPVDFVFTVTNSSKETLYKNKFTFTPLPVFKVGTNLFYSNGLLEIECDIKRLANLPSEFSGLAEFYDTRDNKPITSIPLKGLSAENRTGNYALDIGKFLPGKYVVKAYIKEKDTVIAQRNEEFTIPEKPEWLGNKLGISDKVPAPWTPVEVKGNSVFVWGRENQFDKFPFPSQIITKEKSILSSPIGFEIVTDKGIVKWEKSEMEYIDKTDTKVKIKTINNSNLINMEGNIEIEFDGFIRLDITLTPVKPVSIEKLVLNIPLKMESALYMRAMKFSPYFGYYTASLYEGAEGDVFKIGSQYGEWMYSPKGWIWQNDFMHYVWVGGDETGLLVAFESDENWQSKKYVEVVDKKDNKEIKFNFIDSSYALIAPLRYTVALQATPVKPLPENPKRWLYGYCFGTKPTDGQDLYEAACQYGLTLPFYPELKPHAKETISNYREAGVRILPDYTSCMIIQEVPEFKTFGEEWKSLPVGGFKAGEFNAVGACPKSSYTDFFLWGVNKLINEGKIGGVYLDSPGVITCQNQNHGCGYINKDGKIMPKLTLFEGRELYKRLYTLFKSRDIDSFVFNHDMPIVPVASFLDGATGAEEWTLEKANGYLNLTPDLFRTMYMKTQYGIPFTLYPPLSLSWYNDPILPYKELFPITLIHNVYPTPLGSQIKDLKPIWDIMGEWMVDSEWIPYWRSKDLVEFSQKDAKVSIYRKESMRKSLMLVANLGKSEISVELKVNLSKFGLKKEDVKVTELMDKKEVPLIDSKIAILLPKNSIQFFLLEER